MTTGSNTNNSVYPCPTSVEIMLDTVVHILIIEIVLSVIFHAKISQTEESSMKTGIEGEISSLLSPLRESLKKWSQMPSTSAENVELLNKALRAAASYQRGDARELFNPSDNVTKIRNKSLLTNNIAVLVLLVVFAVVVVATIRNGYKNCTMIDQCAKPRISWEHIGLDNGIIVIIVGIFEYIFITQVALNYVPIDPQETESVAWSRIRECADVFKQLITTRTTRTAQEGKNLEDDGCAVPDGSGISPVSDLLQVQGSGSQRMELWGTVALACVIGGASGHFLVRQKQADYCEGSSNWAPKIIPPILAGCGMCAAVTGVYFYFGKTIEQNLYNRQVQRCVDQSFQSLAVIVRELPAPAQRDVANLVQLPPTPPHINDQTTKEIAAHNAPLVKRSIIMVAAVLGSALVLALGGSRGVDGGKRKSYAIVCGLTVAIAVCSTILAELGFLEMVVANFEPVDTNEIIGDEICKVSDVLHK